MILKQFLENLPSIDIDIMTQTDHDTKTAFGKFAFY